MEHCELLQQILGLDQNVRFVGMYDENYKIITDGFQPGALAHLSREEMQNSIRYDMKRWETYKMFHSQLGDSKFALVKYEKAILITFSFNKNEYLRISLEPDADYPGVISKIENLLMQNPVIK